MPTKPINGTPQLENGYLRIANQLYEQILLADFSKRELLTVMAIIRETYGYGRKSHRISGTQVGRMTGIARESAARTIACLIRRQVVTNQPHDGYNILTLNKNFRQWLPSEGSDKSSLVTKRHAASDKTTTKLVTKRHTTKDSKDNSKDKAQAPVLPDWLNSKDWQSWVAHLKAKRKTPALPVQEAQIRKLAKYMQEGHSPADVIEHSIAGGYQGLYPEKTNVKNNSGSNGDARLSAPERVERATRQRAEQDGRAGFDFDEKPHR